MINTEKIKLKDLVYGLMLRSGNDAAAMIANYVSGSDEEFVNLMNNKAKELGMKNTIFYNPSGLPTPHGNYSSVYDMALLTRYAMKNDAYREIVGTKKYKVTTNKKTYVWNNKNNKKDKEGVPPSGAPSLLFEGRLVKVSV